MSNYISKSAPRCKEGKRQQKRDKYLFFFVVLFCLFCLPLTSIGQQKSAQNSITKPRLVVGIVIDQFRYDYLTRFESSFGEGGFKRLLKKGAVFVNANYLHSPTVTACGHATFMTGTIPALDGIIGNEWFERETGTRVTSVSDSSVKLVGSGQVLSGMSPRRLLSTTIGDEMKLASNGTAKVIGISYKDRSAILPSGKHPDAAYWFDAKSGNFVSSTYYFSALPAWADKFNREQRPDRYLTAVAAVADDSPAQHSYDKFELTPFANDHLVDFARAAIENEQLGADDTTDLLTISFSANDLIGHAYGPYSKEVAEVTLHTDKVLANFFNYLERKLGADRVLIALTADHGVAPVPEQVRALGFGGRVDTKAIMDSIETALDRRFENEKWIVSAVNSNVYFDESVIERRKISTEEVERTACQAVLKITGIGGCFTRSQIISGALPQTAIARSVANGFNPQRNGNIVIVPQPFYIFGEGSGTTHGTPYSYDTHVPLLFYGAGIVPGVYYGACSPADIAPTLSALLKIEIPSNSIGRILSEAIKH
jgi:predicted AlkP superfamily pyrophosphatase or phosphodiesterase